NVLIDPTRFVVDWEKGKILPELPYLAIRLPFMAANYFGADFVIAAVRKEHMPFYRRVLGFEQVAAPRNYHQLTRPVALMMGDYQNEYPRVLDRYSFFSPRPGELEHLFNFGQESHLSLRLSSIGS